jgi:methyl-accepting chemotaxis protein
MPEDVFRWIVAAAVVLACLAFLVQAGVAFAVYRIARNTQRKIEPLVDRAEPILETTRKILEENRPRISDVSAEAVVIAKTTREQAVRIGALLNEASDRARDRIEQIDRVVDHTVEHVENAGESVKTAVAKPVRELNGIMAGVAAALATYVRGGRRSSVDHATQDEEMFI